MGTSVHRKVFTDAKLTDRTLMIDQGDDVLLRIWLPGGIAIEGDPAVDWDVYMNAELDEDDHVVITNLQLVKKPEGPGITAARIRDLPFGDIVDELLSTPPVATLVRRGDGHPDGWEVIPDDIPLRFLAEARRRTQTQRGRRPDTAERQAVLARVAEIARAAKPRQVLNDLEANGFGKPARAKKYLRAARDAGLLEESSRSARPRQ